MKTDQPLSPEHISHVIEMALSDHVSFDDIRAEYGLREAQVKALMRENLRPSSYRTWRKRVRDFSDRRAHYK
ncbi:TIGR03643 family protein [Nereida sp. MMG025]|uniref:TIGR03643 family protein n=1 Tax=Nereida sp. MMG025 TaxID=2909981 RepID=UPI001F20B38F|nr:TIGR03643 family protein [Nereida sp. MMG025]MCF6445770.1 TIGR03643 family protein [Nereida sp. MMG025]